MEEYWLVQEHKYRSAIVMDFLRFHTREVIRGYRGGGRHLYLASLAPMCLLGEGTDIQTSDLHTDTNILSYYAKNVQKEQKYSVSRCCDVRRTMSSAAFFNRTWVIWECDSQVRSLTDTFFFTSDITFLTISQKGEFWFISWNESEKKWHKLLHGKKKKITAGGELCSLMQQFIFFLYKLLLLTCKHQHLWVSISL